MKRREIMATLTAKTTMNYTNTSNTGLWTRFKNYLHDNQQTIFMGMAMMSGNSYYAYSRALSK